MFHYLLLNFCFSGIHTRRCVFDGATRFHQFFFVGNGVKQGGIIFPILFNIYMDDLSMHLNSSGIGGGGGYLGTAFINHLCYADDLCLISLSSSGMQQLLHTCNAYAAEHQLLHNGSKSFSFCFKRKELKVSSPSFFLGKSKKSQWSNNVDILEQPFPLRIVTKISNGK